MNIRRPAAGVPGRPLSALAKSYPHALFFLTTFVYSWVIYLLVWLAAIQNGTVLSRWLLVAAFGPSVAAILVAALTAPDCQAARSRRRLLLLLLAGVGAAAVEAGDHVVFNHQISFPLIVADLVLISLAATVISRRLSSRASVRRVLEGITRSAGNPLWYVFSIALWPCLVILGNAVAGVLGLSVPTSPSYPSFPIVLVIVESFIWYLLFGGPLNEEPGWRGFALTGLQARFSPLTASIIIGAFSGLWHVPLHLMGVYPYGAIGAVIRVFDIPTAIVFTWLFNRTRQSLLPVLFLHSARNTTSLFMSRHYGVSSLLLLFLAGILVFADKMWKRPQAADIGAEAKSGLVNSGW